MIGIGCNRNIRKFILTEFALNELDVFYISFDEPNCEANWKRVQSLHSNAKRIHGVLGFDNAHRACALASNTYRFVTIDGDNWIHDNTLNYKLNDDGIVDVCFSFKSENIINGLQYGNGGIKVWNRNSFLSSQPYESANLTDFCWVIRYYQVDFIGSTTVNNCTQYQAWRAGYREGIKLTYINGKPLENFKEQWPQIWEGNLGMLRIWTSVGKDINNGIWAILGARQGLYELISNECKHTDINDYLWMSEKWAMTQLGDPDITAMSYSRQINKKYNFSIPDLDIDTSKWVKSIYVSPDRHGLMIANGMNNLPKKPSGYYRILRNLWDVIEDKKEFINTWMDVCDHPVFEQVNAFDAFSKGQLSSKLWLVHQLKLLDINLGDVWVLGGWVGSLAYLMFNQSRLQFDSIHSFDLDNNCTILAEILNRTMLFDNWKFKATTLDVNNLLYDNFTFFTYKDDRTWIQITRSCNTVINTSCDHMGDNFTWWNNIPNGTLVILQNNDFVEIKDHNNIVHSIDEFSNQYPMSMLLYSGILDCKLYNRYMLIGRK
jgi:hypothetical protein